MTELAETPDVADLSTEVELGRSLHRPFDVRRSRQSVFSAFMKAKGKRGGGTEIMIDGDERVLTYSQIAQASFGLGSALKKYAKKGENVGVLLPTGAGAVIGFLALSAYGRVPAMLNFTAGPRALRAACKMAEIDTIVTAHLFVEKGGFEDLIKDLEEVANMVYLEDVREGLTLKDKVAGGAGPIMPHAFMARPHPDSPSVILFTSGTEGDPKGVVLSHANVVANIEQVRDHIDLHENDAVFNPLPTFHCFGLTVGALMPLLIGIKTVCHPTPLEAKNIAKRIRKTKSTILLATDTFMNQYARAGSQGDLNSIRLAVCGAERVKDETRQLVKRKYNIDLLEGYGATEAAPVAAANRLVGNRPGTVGVLMAGMDYKLEPVPGIDEGGKLLINGPNIMSGYLKVDKPGVVQPPEEGWHDTGDIVTVDEEGYISIRGRVKRFAKVGGEMVSLAVVENCATSIWEDNQHAAVSIPDPRKGEQIILLSDCKDANRADMVSFAKNHGVTDLAVPRQVLYAPEIPILGTGKVNYGQVQHIVDDLLRGGTAPEAKAAPEPEAAPEPVSEPDAVEIMDEPLIDRAAVEEISQAAFDPQEEIKETPGAAKVEALEEEVEGLIAEGDLSENPDAQAEEAGGVDDEPEDETNNPAPIEKAKDPGAPSV